jgi:hypothetical protein
MQALDPAMTNDAPPLTATSTDRADADTNLETRGNKPKATAGCCRAHHRVNPREGNVSQRSGSPDLTFSYD